jgi:hypothetical protein
VASPSALGLRKADDLPNALVTLSASPSTMRMFPARKANGVLFRRRMMMMMMMMMMMVVVMMKV